MFLDLLSQSPIKRDVFQRETAPIPYTGWVRPTYFPELRDASVIAFDTETKEMDWDHGPGWGRGQSHVIGVSLAALWSSGQRGKWYFPVRHEVEREDNFDPAIFFDYLRTQLHTPNIPKCGANLLFDCGVLSDEGIYPQGPLYDCQFAEALIDETGRVELGYLGQKYVGRGKNDDLCKAWILRSFTGAKETTWKSYLWRTPSRLAGPYAEEDADLPIDVLLKQWAIMGEENTLSLYNMECSGIPMLVRMRRPGIPVDIAFAEQLNTRIKATTVELYAALRHTYAVNIESTAASQLAKLFDSAGIPYPTTSTGKPSFKKEWLKLLDNPVGKAVNDIRELEKLSSTFLEGYILGRARVDAGSNSIGRIYCSFNPLRDDEHGAKTGRFSSSDPNLQNIPARTKIGAEVRKVFIPEPGHVGWHKKDHSQIEYRMLAHNAVGPKSEEIRYRYNNDPATDFHDDTMRDVAALRQIVIEAMSADERDRFRKPIKNVNFGLTYGQTEASLAYKAGWSKEEADEFFATYHATRPFVKPTMKAIQSEVQAYGFITTILGRRLRFNKWEAFDYEKRKEYGALSQDHAVRLFGGSIRRAFAYRGVNYKFQGSAADILKKGMYDCYASGVFEVTGLPKLTVHDELDWSRIDGSQAQTDAFAYITHVMENCVKLSIPLKVDSTEGANWGKAK